MMKIAVCDDSMEDLEKIKGLLTRYMEINKSVRFEIEFQNNIDRRQAENVL